MNRKILFLTNNWLSDYGGRKAASTKILTDLMNHGFDVSIVNFEVRSDNKSVKKTKQDDKILAKTYYVDSHRLITPYLIRLSKMRDFDKVIVSGAPNFDIFTVMAIRASKLFKKAPIVLFCHTHPLKSIELTSIPLKFIILNLRYYLLSHFAYRFFDFIVVPGHGLKDFFISRLGIKSNKISVINYPVYSRRRFYTKRKIKTKGGIKTLVTIARLVLVQKDFPTLFRALREVNVKLNCRLNILGEGISRKPIEELAKRLGVSGQVKFLGFKKNPIDYIKKSDLFVLSSTFEGCPISLVEAMGSGVPVVSSDCDYGPREILENGKNGLLVPVGNHQAMAEAVVRILENNNLRKKLIRNGLGRAKFYSEKKSYLLWNKLLMNGL